MAEASQVGARILKELRTGRNWSWQERARLLKRLAEQHGVERIAAATTESIGRTIARLESGRYAYKPDDRYQLLLAYAYTTRDGEAAGRMSRSPLDLGGASMTDPTVRR